MASRALKQERKLYLCAHEVMDDERRSRLSGLLRNHGDHLLGAVFLCPLTDEEQSKLAQAAASLLDESQDQLLFVDFGSERENWTNSLTCIGKAWVPGVRARIV
jgi:CRISPR/Cas system-associated endoribonuclease Cas2